MLKLDLTTCEISDALIKLGSPHGGYIPDIHFHSPSPTNSDFCVYGPAYTVKMVDVSDQTTPEPSDHFLDTVPPNSIIVIDTPIHTKHAVWGRLMTAGAQVKEVAGVVISGLCRDLSAHRAADFPVFARGHSTLGQSASLRPLSVNVPLVIESRDDADGPAAFAAVTVHPGDWIVADENGVVCVPKNLFDEVVELSRAGREAEAKAVKDILAGKGALASLMLHCGPPRRLR